MNRRKIKKQAKRFLAGLPTRGIAFHYEERYPMNDGSVLIIERVPNSLRFHQEVMRMLRGASHWDSPFIVQIIER
jgi:hypothetical protein